MPPLSLAFIPIDKGILSAFREKGWALYADRREGDLLNCFDAGPAERLYFYKGSKQFYRLAPLIKDNRCAISILADRAELEMLGDLGPRFDIEDSSILIDVVYFGKRRAHFYYVDQEAGNIIHTQIKYEEILEIISGNFNPDLRNYNNEKFN